MKKSEIRLEAIELITNYGDEWTGIVSLPFAVETKIKLIWRRVWTCYLRFGRRKGKNIVNYKQDSR